MGLETRRDGLKVRIKADVSIGDKSVTPDSVRIFFGGKYYEYHRAGSGAEPISPILEDDITSVHLRTFAEVAREAMDAKARSMSRAAE